MKSQPCNVTTDSRGKEMIRHGTPMFPLACYDEDLRDYSVEWHWHEEFEFILVREGLLKVYVENDRICLGREKGYLSIQVFCTRQIEWEKNQGDICLPYFTDGW